MLPGLVVLEGVPVPVVQGRELLLVELATVLVLPGPIPPKGGELLELVLDPIELAGPALPNGGELLEPGLDPMALPGPATTLCLAKGLNRPRPAAPCCPRDAPPAPC